MPRLKRVAVLLTVAVLFLTALTGCADTDADSPQSLSDFDTARIGIMTGSVYDDFAKEFFPSAKRQYYSLMTDMILAVEQGKIDGFLAENTYLAAAKWEGAAIQPIGEAIAQTHAAFIFPKGSSSQLLREEINAFIRKSAADNTLGTLYNKWFSDDEPDEHPDFGTLSGERGTLSIAAATDLKPIAYFKEDAVSGYEMELLYLFAKEYGYQLDIASVTFESILPGVSTGKYHIGTGAFTITDERRESVDFSESHLTVNVLMIVRDSAAQTNSGLFERLAESFEKTFIRESRWKLIAEGIGVTLLISLCSTVAGTLLGFGLYMLTRSQVRAVRRTAGGVAKVYGRIVAGTPVVVILMILFYVVFGALRDISGAFVAIIGFSLIFGAFVYEHLGVAVNSVDRGQTEAAYALGYTKHQTFFHIVMPQAMNIFLPTYCSQAVELIKATAVVGYIAVNDLTKMSDVIRSNTYEAFFPLIATALIYFLLTWGLTLLLGLVKRAFEPKRRRKEAILKGVNTV